MFIYFNCDNKKLINLASSLNKQSILHTKHFYLFEDHGNIVIKTTFIQQLMMILENSMKMMDCTVRNLFGVFLLLKK